MGTRHDKAILPAVSFRLVAAGTVGAGEAGDLPDGTRGLRVGTAGTLNVTMSDGEIITDFPVFQGDNPGRFQSVQQGGTASNIWAIL